MKRLLFLLVFVMAVSGFKYAYCQDNLLAVDKIDNKAKAQTQEDKALPKEQNPVQAEVALEEAKPADDTGEQDLENIRAYRQILENKQKDLEVIKLDLEKSDLMLKKRQAEKEIFEIDKALFVSAEENRALELSARNVPGVQVMVPMGLNVYDILKYDHLVLFSPALAAIEARLAK